MHIALVIKLQLTTLYSFITRLLTTLESDEKWQVSSMLTSVAFDVFQKSRNTLAHLSENLRILVKLLFNLYCFKMLKMSLLSLKKCVKKFVAILEKLKKIRKISEKFWSNIEILI